jgi:hypothetical protein
MNLVRLRGVFADGFCRQNFADGIFADGILQMDFADGIFTQPDSATIFLNWNFLEVRVSNYQNNPNCLTFHQTIDK